MKAFVYKSWSFREAAGMKVDDFSPDRPVIFETGFGPSGRPHIGTFAEVARTTMVLNSFKKLHPERAIKLYVFCDDMDGLRRVPGNVPNRQMLKEHLGKPLHKIPDPFGTEKSYSAHMENELVGMLSRFGFEFELKSSAAEYGAGVFNEALQRVLDCYEKIRQLVLPTLQPETRKHWSPIIPICEKCGRLYTTLVTGHDPIKKTVTYACTAAFGDEGERVSGCGHTGEITVLDGHVKVGWKIDWALRWFTYGVCYEMYGKDLIESARLSGRITKILGSDPPLGMVYEMFLDERGKKISKSVGEGLTVDSWLTYAPVESLFCYLFHNPKKQRRLYFDIIPKSVDDYLDALREYPALDHTARPDSVVWHMERIGLESQAYTGRINFSLILNLISAIGAGDKDLLGEYVRRYDPETEKNQHVISGMIERAALYFNKFIEPKKQYRKPTHDERLWFESILERLDKNQGEDENEFQAIVFDAAREHEADPRAIFRAIYEVILGQERGPRFGTFVKLVGKTRAMDMIKDKLA
ncbi:MAG: lysine--tRNA ligase [Deltaproteobacteria bacterium]|nr:lysine--tRNA ligase [Deltaproteobacteria bacterium]